MQDHKHPTSDRLRDDIDHGAAGDKKGFPDPAAAPLGTDDEAAGTPPTARQREMAHDAEIGRGTNGPTIGPSSTGDRRPISARQSEGPGRRSQPPEGTGADRDSGPPQGVPPVLVFLGMIAAVLAVLLAAWLL